MSEEDFRSVFDNAPSGIAVLSPAGVIIACNSALRTLLERDPAELIGRTLATVTHPDDLQDARRPTGVRGRPRVARRECRMCLPDQRVAWVWIRTARMPPTCTRSAHLIMHVDDITDRKRREAELNHRALHDPLTGLATGPC